MALFTRSRLNATGCTNPDCKDPNCKTQRELAFRNSCHDGSGFHVEYDKESGHLHLSCYECRNPIAGIMVGEEFFVTDGDGMMTRKRKSSPERAKKIWELATSGAVDLVPVLTDQQIAEQLHRYIKFRANQEGKQYSLDPEFFLDALRQNVTTFFGVKIYLGGLESDEQNPEAFAKWVALN